MSVYVDTNILARLLLNDLPRATEEAKALIRGYSPGEVVIIDGVVVELFFIVEAGAHYRLARDDSVLLFEALLKIPQFSISDTARAAFVLFKINPKLDFMDCLLVAHADGRADNLLTFDKNLLKALR